MVDLLIFESHTEKQISVKAAMGRHAVDVKEVKGEKTLTSLRQL